MVKTASRTSGKLRVTSRNSSHFRTFVFCIVTICIVLVISGAYVSFYYAPDKVAERELVRIAKDYYETYYHDAVSKLPEDQLAEATENGLPTVPLRLLYLFDNGRHEDSRDLFETDKLNCNSNSTYVRFVPYAPYGPTDYKMGYTLNCDKVNKRVGLD